MEKFHIVKDTAKKINKFALHGRTVEYKNKPVHMVPEKWVKGIIEAAVGQLKG